VAPEIPTLFSVAQGKPLKESSNIGQLDPWSVIELTVYNDDAMAHTFHLHGHTFWVIKHGHSINLLPQPKTRWSNSKRSLSSSRLSYESRVLSNFGQVGPSMLTYYDAERYPIRDTIEVPPCIIKDSSAGEGGICGGTKGYTTFILIR
jgi:FtsP/CotA-like multicopper oxidase with cupredoxin domain